MKKDNEIEKIIAILEMTDKEAYHSSCNKAMVMAGIRGKGGR